MASLSYHNIRPDQPGLEVVNDGSDGLVVVQHESEAALHTLHQQWPYPDQTGQAEKEVYKVSAVERTNNSPLRRWNIKKVLLVALVCVLVIVGVVVGSVVGTRKASSSSSPPPSPATTSPR